jgi:putative pyruvate synthase
MDYKYINQLLNKYWEGATTLEEENILRSFFSQKDVPGNLIQFRPLFVYEQEDKEQNVLDEQFDAQLLAMVGEDAPVKAQKITLTRRLMPLFKAAAMVAIVLTLGNAMVVSMSPDATNTKNNDTFSTIIHRGSSVAVNDSAVVDTMKQSNLSTQEMVNPID